MKLVADTGASKDTIIAIKSTGADAEVFKQVRGFLKNEVEMGNLRSRGLYLHKELALTVHGMEKSIEGRPLKKGESRKTLFYDAYARADLNDDIKTGIALANDAENEKL